MAASCSLLRQPVAASCRFSAPKTLPISSSPAASPCIHQHAETLGSDQQGHRPVHRASVTRTGHAKTCRHTAQGNSSRPRWGLCRPKVEETPISPVQDKDIPTSATLRTSHNLSHCIGEDTIFCMFYRKWTEQARLRSAACETFLRLLCAGCFLCSVLYKCV